MIRSGNAGGQIEIPETRTSFLVILRRWLAVWQARVVAPHPPLAGDEADERAGGTRLTGKRARNRQSTRRMASANDLRRQAEDRRTRLRLLHELSE